MIQINTWLLVNTLKICKSASGAKPRHSLLDAITPATKVPCPSPSSKVFSFVQLVLSFIFLKCGCVLANPVSNTATLTPFPFKLKKSSHVIS